MHPASFDAKDLQNLSREEAIARIDRAEYDFNLRTYPPPEMPPEDVARNRREAIIELSRRKYATRKEVIESELNELRKKREEYSPRYR